MFEWVVVASYSSRTQAEMMVELLRNEGVKAMPRVDDAGGLRPDIALGMGWAKVIVPAQDEDRAREILEHGGGGGEDEPANDV
ncbi:hypothetical protein DRQ53_09945 [bacterium]|nr:MAG: hypothetical protein DRQ32_00815 [bacterium]RKZ15094.1 MAG: hypothetical protein DRQ53_09945 [bacterium]